MKKSNGLGIPGLLFIIFLVLKLTNNINWSWWWVTSPIWIPIIMVVSMLFLIFLIFVVMLSIGYTTDDIKNKFNIKK